MILQAIVFLLSLYLVLPVHQPDVGLPLGPPQVPQLHVVDAGGEGGQLLGAGHAVVLAADWPRVVT